MPSFLNPGSHLTNLTSILRNPVTFHMSFNKTPDRS